MTAGVDVRAALLRLSPTERACTVLHHCEDLSVADVAMPHQVTFGG